MRSKKRYEAVKYGGHVTVRNIEVGKTLHQMLSSIEQSSRHLILVGFAMFTEFDWISRECPSFLSRFSYWVDVQEIVEASCGSRLGLLNAMAAVGITDRNATKSSSRGHRASNDAVRTLATLSKIMSLGKFEYRRTIATRLLSTAPRYWNNNYPFRARITACDNGFLPSCIKTPRALSALFKAYNPAAVLIKSQAATKGVRVWWICVSTWDSLKQLTVDVDGSVLDGKQLVVEEVVASWMANRNLQRKELEGDSTQWLLAQKDLKVADVGSDLDELLCLNWQGNLFGSDDHAS